MSKKLVKIAGDERIHLRGNGDNRVAHGERGHHNRNKTEQRRFARTDDAHGPNRLVHRDGDIAKRRIVHRAVKLIGPRRIRENALDAEIDFRGRLLFADHGSEAVRNFIAALGKILRAVVENLRSIVRRSLRPRRGLARRLDRVANVFAIAQRSFAQQSSVGRAHLHAVAGVGPRLLASYVELDGSINRGSSE